MSSALFLEPVCCEIIYGILQYIFLIYALDMHTVYSCPPQIPFIYTSVQTSLIPFLKRTSYLQHAQGPEEYQVLTAQQQKKLREAASQKDKKPRDGKKKQKKKGTKAKVTPKETKKDADSTKGPKEGKTEKKRSEPLIPKDQQYKFKAFLS